MSITPVRIVHLLPDLMNLYGDGGNVRILEKRLQWRGIPVDVVRLRVDDALRLADADIVVMGGGPDREQRAAAHLLQGARDELAAFAQAQGAGLFICGAYQMLGRSWFDGQQQVEGLGVFPATTQAAKPSQKRLIGHIVVKSPLVDVPVVGFENHAGRTTLDDGAEPFGQVVNHAGCGNNDHDRHDGCRVGRCIGTYVHGPLLAKSPELADVLLSWGCERHAARTGEVLGDVLPLSPLNDNAEKQTRNIMLRRV